ncbi:MAG: efflux RND transporter permease subunit [Candidatus Omnitrophica bacterium]|nr:efflux RND transporter permease subunit [Candidatus Omnitrophota bacterium]
MGLPSAALKKPVMVAMIFAAFMMMGLIALVRLPVELYQGQNQGIISIVVRARGGLAPVEVEKLLTKPIEEAVATVSNLKNLISNSREAESRVTMEFVPGTDMRFAALEVREKFSRVKPLLPKEIEKPVIANYDDAESAVMIFALTSETLSPEQIREIVETNLKPILTRVDGVASIEIYGGRERKILVEVDRDKIINYNISIERVMDILGRSNVNLLAGNVESRTLDLAVRSMGAFKTIEEIGDIGIKATRQGSIIPLKEVATVKDAYLEPSDFARLNLEQNVTIYVKKTSMASTIPVVKTVRSVLDDFTKDYKKGGLKAVVVSDKAQTISRAISDVRDSLLLGMFLVTVMIFLFLRNWILAMIVLISMPISVIMTFFFMNMAKISINVMTLSGLALAIGILVDSSVVIIENIFSKKERGLEDLRAIREGAEEVWIPLLGSLFAMLIVFLPILFIDKKIQMMYSGFAFTVTVSLIGSFFLAMMLVPVAIRQWASGALEARQTSNWFQKIADGYRKLMVLNLKYRYPVVFVLLLLLGVSVIGLANRSIDWPATYEENEFSVIVFPLAGAKLETNDEAIKKVESLLGKIPDIEMFSTTVRKDDIRIFVRLKPKGKRQYAKDEVVKILDEKGNQSVKEINDSYSLIIDKGAGSSDQKKLIVNLFGHDSDVLQKLAIEAANRMAKVDGIYNLVMTDLRKRPEYSLIVDKGRAAFYGLSIQKVADSVHAQVRGMRPTKFHDYTKGEEIETITRLQAIYRQKIDDLRFIPIHTDAGNPILLGEIANFYPSTGPQTIDRKDKYRYVFVKGDTKKTMEEVAEKVRVLLNDMKFPDDYYWKFGGSYDELFKSKSQLTLAWVLTFLLVYMVLACLLQNYSQPVIVMLGVPFSLIGVWLVLFLTKTPLSQQVYIGLILLAGYVVNAAIIMVDHINHLKKEGPVPEEVLIHAGLDRLRPIMMTTLATVLGFLPMALGWSQSSELWAPLAKTVIGGLLSSTVLTLFVLPNFILIFEEIPAWCRRIFFYRFKQKSVSFDRMSDT